MGRAGVGVFISCVLVAASCSSTDEELDASEAADAISTPAQTVGTSSTSVPEEATTTLDEVPAGPPAIGDLPTLELVEVSGIWGEPVYVGDFAAIGTPAVDPSAQSMLFIEQRGQVEEGCEGGIEPLGRLTTFDLDTGSSTVLIPELELTDTRLALGPGGRFAIVAGCDANAWLAAVGSLSADGTLAFRRLSSEFEDRISGSANAGVSITWTSDGEVLFFDSTRVDAATGERLDPFDPNPTVRVHAELADGTRLVSTPSAEGLDVFWVDDGSAPLDDVMATPPDFTGRSTYPAVRVEIDTAGERAYAAFEDWDASAVHTVVIGGDETLRIDGRATPSPSGSRLLVESSIAGEWMSGWSVIDLESGMTTSVPLPAAEDASWFVVVWGASDDELLISVAEVGGPPVPPIGVWLVAAS